MKQTESCLYNSHIEAMEKTKSDIQMKYSNIASMAPHTVMPEQDMLITAPPCFSGNSVGRNTVRQPTPLFRSAAMDAAQHLHDQQHQQSAINENLIEEHHGQPMMHEHEVQQQKGGVHDLDT